MQNLVFGFFAVLLVIPIFAAGPAGEWHISFAPPDGIHHESTLVLQVDNGTLSGTLSSKRGSTPISDGKVNGDKIEFNVLRRGNGDEIVIGFTGTVIGNTMTLKMQYRDRTPVTMTARRGK